jgi:uncharacterized protein (TIGR02646 family)
MAKDLNIIFKYSKIKPVTYRKKDITKLSVNPILKSENWSDEEFASIKRLIRFLHYKSQKRRCAYCRRLLNPLGINEHIDHLVARSVYHGWMFKPRNLVLACYQCNTQKNNSNILNATYGRRRLQKKSINYEYFNPYIHVWSDHFEIEDSLFIRARTVTGSNTITEYRLSDFKYSMKYAEEANIFGATAIQRATHRMNTTDPNSIEYKSAKKLIQEIERHI